MSAERADTSGEVVAEGFDLKFKERFAGNLVSNIANFGVNVIIGLLIVPFFLDTLGEGAYGLIPLATSMTVFVTLIIEAINTSVSRYLMLFLNKGDIKSASEIYSTSFCAFIVLGLILVPLAFIVSMLLPNILSIGTEDPFNVSMMFFLIFLSMIIQTMGSNFRTILYSYNRIDLKNYALLIHIISQTAAIIGIFVIAGPTLIGVGAAYLFASVLVVTVSFVMSKRVCSEIKFSVKLYSSRYLRELLGMSSWVSVSRIGFLLRMQMALLLINIFCGEIAGAHYSLIITWATLLNTIATLIVSLFEPKIYQYAANDDDKSLLVFAKFTTRTVGLLMALVIGIACIFSPQILTLWVGAEYAFLAPLFWIMVIPVIIRVTEACSYSIAQAKLKYRIPAVIDVAVGFINVAMIVVLVYVFDFDIYGAAFASAVSYVLCYITIMLYCAYIINGPVFSFVRSALPGYLSLGILSVVGLIVANIIPVDSLPVMIVTAGLLSIIYLTIIWKIVMNKNDRENVLLCVPAWIRKKVPTWMY